nr:VP4 [Bat RVJ-like rotavirus BtSY2]
MALSKLAFSLLSEGGFGQNANAENSKELPQKKIDDRNQTLYCYKNQDPIQEERVLTKFNPTEVGQEIGNDAKLIYQSRVLTDGKINIPNIRDRVTELQNKGAYLVCVFIPDNQEVTWSTVSNCYGNIDTGLAISGTKWMLMKMYMSYILYYDTNNDTYPQMMMNSVVGMLSNYDGKYLTFSTNGNIYWYEYYGDSERTRSYSFACRPSSQYIPVREQRKVKYTDNILHSLQTPTQRIQRAVINTTQNGFWQAVTENFRIKIKLNIEAWGVMGGPFQNWLTESGFKTVEDNYTYERDGETVHATTVTTPLPTKEAGYWTPQHGAIFFTGKCMVLSSDDLVNVWYTEDSWRLNNAVYAKNFATDLNQTIKITASHHDFIFRQNKLGGLALIENYPGFVKLGFHSGGFGQIDTSSYTGLAVLLRFRVLNPTFPRQWETVIDNDDEFKDGFASLGFKMRDVGDTTSTIYGVSSVTWQGLLAGYPRKTSEMDVNLTYTALLPSDPEYTTGGSNYAETVTSAIFDSLNDLRMTVNGIIASQNIDGIVGGIMTAVSIAASFPQLIEGVINAVRTTFNFMRNIVSASGKFFKRLKKTTISIKGKVFKIKTKTYFDSITSNVRLTEFKKLVDDDIIFTTLHNFAVSAKKNKVDFTNNIKNAILDTVDLDPIVTSRILNANVPVIAKKEMIKPEIYEAILETVPEIQTAKLIEINPISNNIATLLPNGKIVERIVPYEMIDLTLDNIGGGYAHSLFSLKLRKAAYRLKNKNNKINIEHLLDKILDDRELFDINNPLTSEIMKEIYDEFIKIVNNALVN